MLANHFKGENIMELSKSLFRRFRTLLVFAMVLGLTGWASPTSVSAATEYNQQISFTDDFDGCLGERITVDGIQHIVGRFTRDSNGKLHFGFTRDTRGKGIGQLTGDTYNMIDTVSRTILEVTPGESRVFSEGYKTLLMHQGETSSNDDTVIHFLSTVTVSANGDVTAEVAIQSVECQ
jgi:hypothetical protein